MIRRFLPTIDCTSWSASYDNGGYLETIYDGRSIGIRWFGFAVESNIGHHEKARPSRADVR